MNYYLDLLPAIVFLLVADSLCLIFLTTIIAKFYGVVYEKIKGIA